MSFKILEKNGVDNENIDGAAFNNFSAGGRTRRYRSGGSFGMFSFSVGQCNRHCAGRIDHARL